VSQVAHFPANRCHIPDAVDILTTRPRAFVLVRDRVQGYIHFSDLNRPIVKLPFFVLLEAVERYFFDMLGAEITPELLRTVLDPKRSALVRASFTSVRNGADRVVAAHIRPTI
jgi:hypothetical protein